MSDLLHTLVYWHWFVLGVLLMIAEALFPGTFLLWFGVGALVTGIALFVVPTFPWQVQLVLFAVVSVAAIGYWRRYRAVHPETTSHPALNQRSAQYIGRRFTLAEPLVDGVGHLHVDDTRWRIEGSDLPVGTVVVVSSVAGTTLQVTRV